MKVLYLISGIGPPAGWGTEFIQNLIFQLSKKGVSATIINPIYKHTRLDWKTWIKDVEKKYKVRIISLEAPGWIKERLLLHFALTPFFVTWATIKLLKRGGFDLIHEFSSTPVILVRSFVLKALFHMPIVFTLSVYNNTLFGNFLWFKIFNFANLYLVPSREIIDKLISLGINKKKLVFSPPGINLEPFRKKISQAVAREKLQLPTNKFILSYFGSLTKEKGILDLIEAVKLIKREIQGKILITLFAVWKGSGQHQKIKEEIESMNFSCLKLVEKYVDIPTLLAASDAVILPQKTGFGATIPPISVLETLAAGKPLIATNIIGVKELINTQNSIIIQPNNSSDLKVAIEKIYRENPLDSKNISLINQYSITRSTKLNLEVYKKVI